VSIQSPTPILPTPKEHGASRLDFLDAGRGIAILGVMAVHTVQHFATGMAWLDFMIGCGQFGVQLFYIISAYTMSYTLDMRIGRERNLIVNFWIRRYCRIALPFWAGMAVYEGFRAAGVGYFSSISADLYSLITSTFLVQGFWPGSLSSVVPGGGTIATEAIFYMIFPLIFLMRGNVARIALFGVAVVISDHWMIRPLYRAAFSSLQANFSGYDIEVFFYYYILNQLPIFLSGIYLYVVKTKGFQRSHLLAAIPLLLVYSVATPKLAAIGLLGFGLLILLSNNLRIPAWLPWIGRYSYSLYLFHFAVLNLILVWGPQVHGQGIAVFLMGYAAVVIGAIGVSLVTKPLLEDGGTKLGRLLVALNERRAVSGGLTARPPPA
jgi:peptidoglycan/LPS O-acetylase OafA/YrhL